LGRLRSSAEKSEVTILRAELRAFRDKTAQMALPEVHQMLNDYFAALTEPIHKLEGMIDSFSGDAVLAVFGSPADPDQHKKALRAASSMKKMIDDINQGRTAAGQVTCEIAIGIHCGEVFHGFVGTSTRCDFAVIGEPLNLAQDYCRAAQGSEVLLSPQLYQAVCKWLEAEKAIRSTHDKSELIAYRPKTLPI